MSVGHSSTKNPPEQARQRPPGDPPGYAVKTALSGSEKPSGAAGNEDGQIGASLGSIANSVTPPLSESEKPSNDGQGLGIYGAIRNPPLFLTGPYAGFFAQRWGPAPDLPPLETGVDRDAPLVRQLTYLRSIAQEILADDHAIQSCGRRRVNIDMPKVVTYNEQTEKAHYVNAQTCQNRVACPFCHSLSSQGLLHKGAILEYAVEKSGLHPIMISFTLHHTREDSCGSTYQVLSESLRRFRRGAPWKRFKERIGLVVDVVGTDYTWTHEHGHHPHKHFIGLLDKPLTAKQLQDAFEWVADRWRSVVKKEGRWASSNYGVRISAHHGDFVEYITGLGDVRRRGRLSSDWSTADELTAGNLFKLAHGYTAWDLLRAYDVAADLETKRFYADVFRDYAAGMAGANLLRICNGFFDHELIDMPDGWDTEIGEETDEAGRIVVGALAHEVDVIVHRRRAIGLMLAEVAEQNGSEAALWSFLLDRVGVNYQQLERCYEETDRVIEAVMAEPDRSVLDVILGIGAGDDTGEDGEDTR